MPRPAAKGDRLVTSGGRVVSVCGRGSTLTEALGTAYDGVSKIHFDGMWFRSDIGRDTLKKLGTSDGGA